MIARTHRFHGYNALRHVYTHGQTIRGPHLAIKYLANQRRTSYRAAVVVSRKVHKSAVVRGRIRRRIYEIIRGQEAQMQLPYDLVVTVFNEQLATLSAPELQQQVVGLLERAHVVGGGVTTRPPRAVKGSHAIVDAKEPDL